eukprot:m.173349 g.173349  ORF g.173349 m.173349 type:complete len:675 (-) comp16732_c0_seq2:2232-4256(-)
MAAPEMIVLNFLSDQKIYRQDVPAQNGSTANTAVAAVDIDGANGEPPADSATPVIAVSDPNDVPASTKEFDRGANGIRLQDKVKEMIKQLNIQDVVWQRGDHVLADKQESTLSGSNPAGKVEAKGNEDKSLNDDDDSDNGQEKIQVFLPSVGGERTERILSGFQNLGFGEPGSHTSLWILPMVLRLPEASTEEKGDDVIRARVTVAQIINNLKSAAAVTLDYIGLCFAASVIAAIGLGRDDTVATVASMLISPLMGPILAYTFGTVVHDKELKHQGLYAEAIGLAICVVTGFLLGIAAGDWGEEWDFPSEFMRTRGTGEGILVGLGIAIPSGIGVALSVLGNNTGSLVGVAISASLLPPAVNFGMLWGFGVIAAAKGQDSDEVAKYFELGIVSFALTIMNIVVIFIMGIFSLNIKSAIPRTAGATELWKHDVPAYRHYKDHNTKNLQKQWQAYMASKDTEDEDPTNNSEEEDYATSTRVERITALQQQREQNARGVAYDAELALKPITGTNAPDHPANLRRRNNARTLLKHKTVYSTRAPGASTARNRITEQHFQTPETLAESTTDPAAPESVTGQAELELVERPIDRTRPTGAPLSRPSVMFKSELPEWYNDEMKSNDPIRAARPAPARKLSESMFRKPSESSLPTQNNEEAEGDDGSVAANSLGASRRSDVV